MVHALEFICSEERFINLWLFSAALGSYIQILTNNNEIFCITIICYLFTKERDA